MNRYALALAALGLFSGVACKGDDSSSYVVSDSATPMTLAISGMT
jgi:hypothetical protein